MSESVKILIEAENKASAVIADTAKDIDNRVQAIKAGGEQAKKSTEFFGVIANSLGGTQFAAFAGQLAGLTEKTAQFAEMQKLGGAGVLAFRAGLVAVVGTLSLHVGKALGNAIFQNDKWIKSLTDAIDKSKELQLELNKLSAVRFSEQREDIELIRDPEGKKAQYKSLLDETQNNLAAVEKRLQSGRKTVKEWKDGWLNNTAGQTAAEALVADDESLLKSLTEERNALFKLNSERTAEIALIKEQNALQDKSESYLESLRNELAITQAIGAEKQNQLKAKQGGAFGDEANTEAANLLASIEKAKADNTKREKSDEFLIGLREEIELLKAKKDEVFAIEAGRKAFGAEAINEAAQLLAEREALIQKRDAAKQVADIRQRELDRLEEERILLEKGKEAAHAFNLEKQGLTKADAQRIASEQAAVDKIKAKQAAKQDTPELRAVEGRLLTRGGSSEDPAKQVAKNTSDAVKELQALNKRLMDERKYNTTIKVLR